MLDQPKVRNPELYPFVVESYKLETTTAASRAHLRVGSEAEQHMVLTQDADITGSELGSCATMLLLLPLLSEFSRPDYVSVL